MLQSKQPEACIPAKLEDLGIAPPLPRIVILQETVEELVKKMGWGTGPGGVDASQLQLWIK